jgi:alpha(1,3/1,4) fucosyltransferase
MNKPNKMSKPKLKIFFTDFWPVFDMNKNIFVDLLKDHYDLVISPDDPDYLFYSFFGYEFNKYKCTRIFFSGESAKPDFRDCDFSFSCYPNSDDSRNYRLPQYYQYGDMEELTHKPRPEEILAKKTKFCNFIYSNPSCKKRNEFFKKLSKYKKVDSAGRFMNNIGTGIGSTPQDKWDFMLPYKFTIAFENEEIEHYTTEKIYEAMKVNSIPIYWGNRSIELDFNTASFLNYYDYGSDEALIEKIIELDKNDDEYLKMLSQPWFKDNKVNDFLKKENIMRQLDHIFSSKITPVGTKSPYFMKNPIKRRIGITRIILNHLRRVLSRKIKYFSIHKLLMKVNIRR